ncbi:probable cytochrome P450 9f2 [Uranotaenia lowii]|uniref:probable cytochrome P450 9f2 n=1 Tax=Uranotaenia lowii TaxID=190385 RepID=UPI00247A39CD|nr:probable cytochrome P450 9f2 [Uranotaenia lowii]
MNVEDLYWFSFILITLVGFYTFKLLTKNRSFFSIRGVPHEKPHLLYGNQNDTSGKLSALEHVHSFYKKFADHKLFGFHQYQSPVFYIRDPDLIGKLWDEKHDHFENHGYFLDQSKDAILGNQLHLLKGEKWKRMRGTLSPTLDKSSVGKMHSLVQSNVNHFLDYLGSLAVGVEYDFKPIIFQHVFNVYTSSSSGLKIDSFHDDSYMCREISTNILYGNVASQTLKTFLFYLFPSIMKKMNVQLMSEAQTKFLLKMLRKSTEEQDSDRSDFLTQLITASSDKNWNHEELIAQLLTFYGIGYDKMVNLLCFCVAELAINQSVQQKLLDETKSFSKGNIPLTYDSVNKMPYLEMVVQETLRKWPVSPSLDRTCSKDYQLIDGDLKVQFRRGDTVMVSVWALHRDEQLFPNPDEFNPERFDESVKANIRPNTFIPFGIGPRNCIGMHFALFAVKLTLVELVRKFELIPGSKMAQPIRLAKTAASLEPEGGFWIQFNKREARS